METDFWYDFKEQEWKTGLFWQDERRNWKDSGKKGQMSIELQQTIKWGTW